LHRESGCSHGRAPKAGWASPWNQHSQLASKRSIQDRLFEAVEFGVGALLGEPESCDLGLDGVKISDDAALCISIINERD
jgi:hypothetical protein